MPIPDIAQLVSQFTLEVENKKNLSINLRHSLKTQENYCIELDFELAQAVQEHEIYHLKELQELQCALKEEREQALETCLKELGELEAILHDLHEKRKYFRYLEGTILSLPCADAVSNPSSCLAVITRYVWLSDYLHFVSFHCRIARVLQVHRHYYHIVR